MSEKMNNDIVGLLTECHFTIQIFYTITRHLFINMSFITLSFREESYSRQMVPKNKKSEVWKTFPKAS